MDKERLVETVKEWILVDNQMIELQKKLKVMRQEKKELSNILVDIMRNNEIDAFDVNDGKLIYSERKVKTSMSKKHILKTLGEFFKDDVEKATEVTELLLNSREEKQSETIKRKINK